MMNFSDEDLKELEEQIDRYDYVLGKKGKRISALIKRLKAAERVCKAAECVRDELNWGDERQMALRDVLVIELDPWHKSKGDL